MSLCHPDGTSIRDPILGLGRSGAVFTRQGKAIKIPQVIKNPKASCEEQKLEAFLAESNRECFEREKEIYRRLETHPGIVEVFSTSDDEIEMAYMKNGCLRLHLHQLSIQRERLYKASHELEKASPQDPQGEVQESPAERRHLCRELCMAMLEHDIRRLQLATIWIPRLSEAVKYVHEKRIIVADLDSRNVLLDEDMSARLCDFGDSGLLPLDADMRTANDYGLSAQSDIFQFGSLMYEIVAGQRYEYDLMFNEGIEKQREEIKVTGGQLLASWPDPAELPETETLYLGDVIRKCWTRSYLDMGEVCDAIEKSLGTCLVKWAALRIHIPCESGECWSITSLTMLMLIPQSLRAMAS